MRKGSEVRNGGMWYSFVNQQYRQKVTRSIMKRAFKAAVSLFLSIILIAGCSAGSTGAVESNPLDGTYYCQRVMVYDQNQNLQKFYNSEALGAENTALTITNGKDVEFKYYYHGEMEKELQGSLRDVAESNGYATGKILFEGDAAEYTLSYETDEETGRPSKLALVSSFGENGNYLGFSLSGEQRTASSGPYENLEDAESKLNGFESSNTYSDVKQVIEQTFSGFEHTLDYDGEQHTLTLNLYMDGLKAAVDQSSEVASSFKELCSSLDNIESSVQTAINAGGYKGVRFIIAFNDGSELLYYAENGARTAAYQPSVQSTAPVETPKPSPTPSAETAAVNTSTSFENSETYRKIEKQMLASFSDNSPKVTYRNKDHMLTVTLTGGKNWEDAILNDSKSYLYWLDFTENLNGVSASGYAVLCDEGYSDIAFTIMVVSYNDPSKALYACMNGETYYDFTLE